MIGKIQIFGHIGDSYVDKQGQLHKGTNLLNVIEQAETFTDATEYEVVINSPGGYVDVGNAIYDFLESLKKKGKKVTTIQTGLIGSIATKIFLAGDRRIVDDRYEFWIHNPFQENVSGDQDELRAAADAVAQTEKDLRKFYAQFTGITDEGLDGLMKIETGLTADQCIKFKFATEKKLVPAFNFINPKNKKVEKKKESKKDEQSLMEHIQSYFTGKNKKKGIQPKASVPGKVDAKSLVVNLADGGGSFWVEGEALAEGAPCFLLDEAGQPTQEPLADGDYTLEDGAMISVMEGKIATLKAAEEEEEEVEVVTFSKKEVDQMIKEAVEAATAEIKTEIEDQKSEIMAIKKNTKLGVQPQKAVLKAQVDGKEIKPMGSAIGARLLEKQEQRRKQLNGVQ